MNEIKVIVIDDETSAQNTLIGMLHAHCPEVRVLGKASHIGDGVHQIETLKPDLVFLDIHLSAYESGLDVVGRTKHLSYGIIFVTAYSQYAIRAINAAQPWAYLVKPFSADDLMEAVRIAGKKIQEKANANPNPGEQAGIVVTDSRKGSIVIRFNEIVYCKSDQSVTEIAYIPLNRLEKVYTYQSLKQIHEELPEKQFCRSHHGFIVNLAFVTRFEKNGRAGIIHLSNGMQVPVSVKKTAHFEDSLRQFVEGGD